MGKYIRTKDGIYEPTKWQCDLSGEMILVKADNKFGNDKVFTRDIIKQADTIEELCDNFVRYVAVDDFHNILRDYEFKDLKLIGERIRKTDDKVYGAIWTDKGLIYVAKMNDKGVLELL